MADSNSFDFRVLISGTVTMVSAIFSLRAV